MVRTIWLVCLVAVCATALPACGRSRTARAERTAELFISALVREDYAAAARHLDVEYAKRMPPDELQNSWTGLIMVTGPFREKLASQSEHSDGDTIVTITCAFERRTMELKVTLNESGEITGIRAVSADKEGEPAAAPATTAEDDGP